MNNDSTSKTIIVATLLCVICSVMVSWAAVSLKPQQTKNKVLDIKRNLLLTAGLINETVKDEKSINEAFSAIETKVVDLATGEYVDMDAASFDSEKAAKEAATAYSIPASEDVARIKSRAKYEIVYLVKQGEEVTMIVLPVKGKGLWSTLYGFLVLAPDTTTVKGLSFYQHGETPGLGGEVDNPNWKQLWVGKKAFNENWEAALKVIKGQAPAGSEHEIDGLSGATLTSNGVSGLMKYWLGGNGFGPFLAKLRAQGASL